MTILEEPREIEVESLTVDERGTIVSRASHTCRLRAETLGDLELEMLIVPAGSFLMGSGPSEGYDDERPRHSVAVRSFLLGRYPVTQYQWREVMGSLPRVRSRGDRRPVDRVSWHDATAFCERLSRRTGRWYRLPSETEWEYACRAGTATPFYCGPTITTDLANYVGEHTYRLEPQGVYRHASTDVGSLPANPWGLHDMHGNVWEWCADAWHADYGGAPFDGRSWEGDAGAHRVMRGGCWHDPPNLCRSATRLKQGPAEAEDFFGFRVALTSWEPGPVADTAPGRQPPSLWDRVTAALTGRRPTAREDRP